MTDWKTLRAHYAAHLAASGLTQAEVAKRGGLSGQNAISKLLANTRKGPAVETWLRALAGLGLSLADVSGVPPSQVTANFRARLDAIETAVQTTLATLSPRRPHDSPPTAVPPTDALDERAALIRAALDPLFDRLARDLDAALDARRVFDSDATAGGAGADRSLRRGA